MTDASSFLARFMVSKNRKIAKRVAEILHEFITARIELYKKKKAGEDVTLPVSQHSQYLRE